MNAASIMRGMLYMIHVRLFAQNPDVPGRPSFRHIYGIPSVRVCSRGMSGINEEVIRSLKDSVYWPGPGSVQPINNYVISAIAIRIENTGSVRRHP